MCAFVKGDHVLYLGRNVPTLRDAIGTVIDPHARNGWIEVDFIDGTPSLCAPINLRVCAPPVTVRIV